MIVGIIHRFREIELCQRQLLAFGAKFGFVASQQDPATNVFFENEQHKQEDKREDDAPAPAQPLLQPLGYHGGPATLRNVNAPADYQQFIPLPSHEQVAISWPTPNHFLFVNPGRFFARTRVNPDYGKPGWTRDCGKRFHRGCDIAPINVTVTGRTTTVIFTDCATGKDFESVEPTFIPHDDVFRVFEGVVVEMITDESISDFGKHVVLEHRWPQSGEKFFTLYAHLVEIDIAGQRIGRMGQTSRSADARNWMAIAPHLHFEVWNAARQPYGPVEFLRRFLPAR